MLLIQTAYGTDGCTPLQQDTLAVRLPPALASAQAAFNAKYMCLYFRRGKVIVGVCKLPIAVLIQALWSQARFIGVLCGMVFQLIFCIASDLKSNNHWQAVLQASGVQVKNLLPNLQQSADAGAGWRSIGCIGWVFLLQPLLKDML